MSENKLAVALACRAAMQEHRKGKPVAFELRTRPDSSRESRRSLASSLTGLSADFVAREEKAVKVERIFPKPPPEFTLTFSKDEGWALVMALRDAVEKYRDAADRGAWASWAAELDAELRRGR